MDAGSDAGLATGDSGPVDAGSLDAGPTEPDAGAQDAGPECSEGETRLAPCGFCGEASETCSAEGRWERASACLGEGECQAGIAEDRTLAMCAVETRLCRADCTWSDWEETGGPGECEVDQTRIVETPCAAGETQGETCGATCAWEITRACSNPCAGTPRTTPDYAREVCVPAGDFIRGDSMLTTASPVAEVYLDAYFIDRYPVTNRRYQACITAGGCTGLSSTDLSRPDYPINIVNHAQASQFCAWDGGRRLPTEAEWEKAVRGPSPRSNRFPYDGDVVRCDLVETGECTGSDPGLAPDRYDELPGSESYYHTFLQWAGAGEHVSDWYSDTYYSLPESLTNPSGPTTGSSRASRGGARRAPAESLARRYRGRGTIGFRCARDGG